MKHAAVLNLIMLWLSAGVKQPGLSFHFNSSFFLISVIKIKWQLQLQIKVFLEANLNIFATYFNVPIL